ncbi:Oncoprotein-induced transcript 3 protein [Triplophysa tibetana]|uniref:Oncoprotein-induced transcript 3 protein n=1 Tax=Triplophysa tibetana TaxID=1572043 RepID=A0A5A9PSM1_9TELE|nr:Oncoprotein-induced transcript 3 protein [Triplophysa tibetana]
MNIQMSETCVNGYSCNSGLGLWLNGPHPQIEDDVVVWEVCGGNYWGGNCCDYKSKPIRVKACPGNYYVYELVKPPQYWCSGYCTDVSTITPNDPTTIPAVITGSSVTFSDPCSNYNILDDYRRNTGSDWNMNYYSDKHDDTRVKWDGWYRLFINGSSAQMPEWCFTYMYCGGVSSLYLGGSHPRVEDGVVTRQVYGSYNGQCSRFTSNPIQVKACPGDYYVYELTRPDVAIPAPSYCAVSFSSISDDPCYNYESLDRPWRATNESGLYICDESFSWSGWYRLYHYGMNIQMSETCVNGYSCNSGVGLSLNGPHPQIEEGLVFQEVCGGYYWGGNCCDYKSKPIRVKACPGNYYVYELVKPPQYWCSGYCTDVSTITPNDPTTIPAVITGSSVTFSDPCSNYNILDDYRRNTHSDWNMNYYSDKHDDTRVKWDGWYRLFINGSSAQMPEWCFSYMYCGGVSSLYLGGSHPGVEDGVVTRQVYGSYNGQCSRFTSNPIQVKACPGDYYVYELTRPDVAIPAPSYCAVSFNSPSVDPCDSYTSLDEPWRSTDHYYNDHVMCDYNVEWNGWYRLFINGQSAQMSESCVSQGMCGTYNPLYLRDPHPQLEDGVVTRHVCIAGLNGCCSSESNSIQVKACPGDYYVYEFVKPLQCAAYCAEDTGFTTLTPTTQTTETPPTERIAPPITPTAEREPCTVLSCTEDERCGEKNGVYGCFCNENQTRSEPHSFDFSETCESSSGSISLSRCQLFEAGFSAHVLHLNEPSCRGTIQNGRVHFHFDNNDHICGTKLVANGTHIIYENFILGTPESGAGLISREKILKLNFSCIYPQTQTLSMIDINPLETRVNKDLPSGEGRYQVRMVPYQDSEFSQPFTGHVDSGIDEKMFVEVGVDGVDSRQFATVIDTCWATPVNDPDNSLRWDLITGECPNPQDNTVELLQNGVSTSSRFSFRMFIFSSNFTKVYLHCSVHLCLLTNNHCSADCYSGFHQRMGRSLDFYDSSSISMGPLVWSEGNSDAWSPETVIKSGASGLCGCLIILLVSLLNARIIF